MIKLATQELINILTKKNIYYEKYMIGYFLNSNNEKHLVYVNYINDIAYVNTQHENFDLHFFEDLCKIAYDLSYDSKEINIPIYNNINPKDIINTITNYFNFDTKYITIYDNNVNINLLSSGTSIKRLKSKCIKY